MALKCARSRTIIPPPEHDPAQSSRDQALPGQRRSNEILTKGTREMATVDKLPMLAEGYEKLQTDVRHLKTVERPAIIDAIEEARGHGDLSENAEYHAAKERQGQVESQIADLEDRISRAMVIDPATLSGDKVIFGATVHLRDEHD